jgi:hypothetical protein
VSDDIQKDAFAALGGMVAVAGVLALPLAGTFYETWIAMTIWRWFAPWALPFTLAQGVGMNMAVSLIFRHAPHGKDTRTEAERWGVMAMHLLILPTVTLWFAWLLHAWIH